LERGKKIFGKIWFFSYILARLVRFFAATAVSWKQEKKRNFFNKKTSFERKSKKIEKKVKK